MTSQILKIILLAGLISIILVGFRYITPTGHLPTEITNAVSYIKSTLNWVSYNIIGLDALLTGFFIILSLESALLFLKLVLWIINFLA
jgi:hypothetical protein